MSVNNTWKNWVTKENNKDGILVEVVSTVIIVCLTKIVGLFSYIYWLSFFKRCRIPMEFYDDAIIPIEDKVLLYGTVVAICLSFFIVRYSLKKLNNKGIAKSEKKWSEIVTVLILVMCSFCLEFVLCLVTWGSPCYGVWVLSLTVVFVVLIYIYSALGIKADWKIIHRTQTCDMNKTTDKKNETSDNVELEKNGTDGKGDTNHEGLEQITFSKLRLKIKAMYEPLKHLKIMKQIGYTIISIVAVLFIFYSLFLYGGFKNDFYTKNNTNFASIPVTYSKETNELMPGERIHVIFFETEDYYYTVEGEYRYLNPNYNQVVINNLDHTLLDKNSVTVSTIYVHSTAIVNPKQKWAPPSDKKLSISIAVIICYVQLAALFWGLTFKSPDENIDVRSSL